VFLNPCGGLGLPKVHDPKTVLACMCGSTLKEASANTKFWLDGQGELLDGKHVSGAGLPWLLARLRAYEQLWEEAVGVYDPSLIPKPELIW